MAVEALPNLEVLGTAGIGCQALSHSGPRRWSPADHPWNRMCQ